ncbi:GNAT family N-acetyltransferase [Aminipila luticellarii]|uniref:GNAT family N-acetyltransferase n=1 Tax=Aminipila luticellarii TaxID=2507160 RepID=A0A410PU56_9FIRM|nr:GNAT family N-acetyltransferase [Aminipila luticellarii]QAT42406.1 GNAT family N-acetyltransferase [Aminipila luticellarii]
MKNKVTLRMSQTDDYEALKTLYIKNDLEVDPDEPMPEGVVKNWKITLGCDKEGMLVAGLTLAKYEGEYIIDGIAVEPEYRKLKIGKTLLEKAVAEVRSLGGEKIFLVARAPEFFRKEGFITIDSKAAPDVFDCMTCPQFGVQCHPEVMRLDLV